MRILFATFGPLRQGPAGPTSDLASTRYRVLLPAQQLVRLGHQVRVASPSPEGWPTAVREIPSDVLVISKSSHASSEALASAMKAKGVKVIADYCDDHFDHPQFGDHFRNLANLADELVAATPAMAEALRKHTGREAIVISDPVEGPRGFPKFAPTFPALRLLWFGHLTNLAGVLTRSAELKALVARMPVELNLVTSDNEHTRGPLAELAGLDPERLKIRFTPWSTEATWKALGECDIVWIPVREGERTSVKSPNRLVEALWAGKYVIADPLESYRPFADIVSVGQGLEAGVEAALADPEGVEARIREGQRRIARDHSAFECGRQWAKAAGDAAERPLRLNLGCGDKILPGYVNVDVVESRAGQKPDVVCDLHDLAPFASDSADEILSVHVVEHFWRWEVRDILREWVRVLKPGAKMIVECPNLQSACQTFLEDPQRFSREDKDGQRTMWVFYGDPAWKDPLMIHRWGYTPDSLRALLEDAGLKDVRQEQAQFKLREPRDMRIVGVKA